MDHGKGFGLAEGAIPLCARLTRSRSGVCSRIKCCLLACRRGLDSLVQEALYQGNSLEGGAWHVHGRCVGGRQGQAQN